jgi:hypothetical protein
LPSPTRERSHRDLASLDIWEHSLDRSRRRRVLAEDARKTIARRKHASIAVSAAMAATPIAPSVIASAMSGGKRGTTNTRKLDVNQGHNRVLLKLGAVSPSVAEVQRKLQVADDGYFGPVTQKAVRAFQKANHLSVTGKIDVKTWLKLFPDGMILYAPQSGLAQLASHAPANAVAGTAGQTGQISNASLTTASAGSAAPAAQVTGGNLKAAGGAPSALQKTKAKIAGATGAGASGPSGGATVSKAPTVHSGSGSSGGGGGSTSSGGGGGGPSAPTSGLGSAGQMISAMIGAANNIDAHHYSYRWGGGHANFSGPYDCSGAVSAVLHAAGLLSRPMVSGDFAHWGRPGRGAVTIYANAGHVYMSILGRYFGTSYSNPGGGAGWFNGGPRPGFVVVHVPFESMHLTKKQLAKLLKAARRQQRLSGAGSSPGSSPGIRAATYRSVTPGYTGQAPGTAERNDSASGGSRAGSGGSGSTGVTHSDGTVQPSTRQASNSASDGSAGAGTQQASAGTSDQYGSGSTADGSTTAASQAPATTASQQAPASQSSGAADGSSSGGTYGSSGASSGAASTAASDTSSSGSQGSAPSGSGSSGSASSGSGSSGSGAGSSSGSGSSGSGSGSGSSGSGSSGSGQGSSGSAGSGVAASAGSTASSTASSASSSASSAAGSAEGSAGSAASSASSAAPGSAGSGSSGSGSGSSGSSGSNGQ